MHLIVFVLKKKKALPFSPVSKKAECEEDLPAHLEQQQHECWGRQAKVLHPFPWMLWPWAKDRAWKAASTAPQLPGWISHFRSSSPLCSFSGWPPGVWVPSSRHGATFLTLDLEELSHAREILLVGLCHLLLGCLWVHNLQTLEWSEGHTGGSP